MNPGYENVALSPPSTPPSLLGGEHSDEPGSGKHERSGPAGPYGIPFALPKGSLRRRGLWTYKVETPAL